MACVRIKPLNRGAEEQEYSAVKQNTEDFAAEEHTANGKGYLRRNAVPSFRVGHTGEYPHDCHRP